MHDVSLRRWPKFWYEFFSLLDKDAQARFMNYGYAELFPTTPKIELKDMDDPNRYSIQLYQHLTRAIELAGLDVPCWFGTRGRCRFPNAISSSAGAGGVGH